MLKSHLSVSLFFWLITWGLRNNI